MSPIRKKISVVTPCYNEEENVTTCYEEIKALFDNELKDYDREHIFCDNASVDGTVKILEGIAANDPSVKVIVNANNFGVFRSMFNGLLSTSGDAVVPFMPADLQDPPEVIPLFVAKWEEGYKVVYGQRNEREEFWFKRMLRGIYYRFIKRYSSVNQPLDAGEFQLIDKQVVTALRQFDDYQPYLRGMIFSCGFKSTGIPYRWKRRMKGVSKAGLLAMFDQGLNGMVSSTNVPIRFGMIIGILISIFSVGYALFNILLYIFAEEPLADKGIMTLIVALFMLSGIQIFFTSLVGEYVASIHSQVRKGPLVIEEKRINF
jgi:glycosyltransferase involved in cell wall biosynthesis